MAAKVNVTFESVIAAHHVCFDQSSDITPICISLARIEKWSHEASTTAASTYPKLPTLHITDARTVPEDVHAPTFVHT